MLGTKRHLSHTKKLMQEKVAFGIFRAMASQRVYALCFFFFCFVFGLPFGSSLSPSFFSLMGLVTYVGYTKARSNNKVVYRTAVGLALSLIRG